MKDKLRRLRQSTIGAGVLASYANTGVSIVCNFIVIPIYLTFLTQEDNGLWMTISGVTAYLGLLNFGIAQSTANLFGAAVARQDTPEQSRAIATGFWAYASVAGSAILILLLLGPWLPWHYLVKGSVGLPQTTKLVFLVAPICFLIELPFTLFTGCLRNIGKIHLQQSIAVVQTIAKLIVAFIYLWMGGSLVGLIVAISCTNLSIYLCCLFFLKRELPTLSIHVKHFDRRLRREMSGPSFYFFLLQISGAICISTDALVISARLGTEQVTPYGIAQKIGMMAVGVVTAISVNFGPSFLREYSQGALRQLGILFKRAMLISVGVGTLVSVAMLVIGPFFIPLWVGDENYVGFFPYLMIVGLVFMQMVLNPCDSLLTMTGNHKTYAVFAFLEALINLGLSILLVSRYGVAGVAMGTLVARIVVASPVMLWQSFRLIRMPQEQMSVRSTVSVP